MFNTSLFRCMAKHRAIHHPTHHAPHKDRQRSSDAEISTHSEGERAHAKKFNNDHDSNTKQDQSPGEFAAQNAIDDSGHETALRRSCLFAADALNPLDFNLTRRGVVEILAI